MLINIYNYAGTYTVRVGSSQSDLPISLQVGDTINIGTGAKKDAPVVDGNRVGLSIYRQDQRVFPPPGSEPVYFNFDQNNLVWIGPDINGNSYMIQWSLIILPQAEPGSYFYALYGTVVQRDPDVVGVWGADDQRP